MIVVFAAFCLWFSAASLYTPPSQASTSSTLPPIERLLEKTSPSLDKIVSRYVQEHMFDDDAYDPVESLYREAYDDATRGSYPQALRDVAASILGQDSVAKNIRGTQMESTDTGAGRSGGGGVGVMLTSAITQLKRRLGLSETAAIFVLASLFVVAGPSVFLFVGMIIGGISKRNINRVMKKRYGDTYTVDATIKRDDEVTAPDDEEDEDEDDDEDDDDDDDDEDDDDEDDKGKGGKK